MGQNMDSSLFHVASNQVTLAGIGMAKAQQGMPQGKPSKTGMGKMKIGEREQTRAQAAQGRTKT
jgi:hypothetical protein